MSERITMEAISAGGAQSAPRSGIPVNLSETPKRPDEAATVNNRVNSVQTVVETQAGLSATQSAPPFQQSVSTSGLEQRLRQSAVQANGEKPATPEPSNEGNARSAVNTFRNVSQLSSGNTTAIGDSAGLSGQVDGAAKTEGARLSIEV